MASEEGLILYGPRRPVRVPAVSVGEYYLSHLEKYGEKTALLQQVDGSELSYSELLRRGKSVAGLLKERGLGSGDTVVLCCGNSLDFAPVMLGTLFVGAALAPLDSELDTGDTLHAMEVIKPQAVITNAQAQPRMEKILSQYDHVVPLITMETVHASWSDDSYLAGFSLGAVEDPGSHVALVMCSSGSSGKSKGVEFTHYRLLSMLHVDVYPPADPGFELTILNADNPCWSTCQMMHLYSLTLGYKLILIETCDVVETFFKAVEEYKINMTMLIPRNIVSIAKCSTVERYDLSSLQDILFAGSVMSPVVLRQAQDKLPQTRFTNSYGSTEVDGQLRPAYRVTHKPNTIGTLGVNMAAKVVDLDTGKLLGPNCQGELRFRTWTAFTTYRGNPQATRDSFDEEGFFRSGDLGYYDDDGYFYIVDRVKEVFKYLYIHVSPNDIEQVLLQHPAVLEAAVVGIPHVADCAHARAYLVLRPGANVSEQELLQLVQDKLPSYKWLYGGARFLESLPRTATGKVKKYQLRKLQ